jgi:hypothetical protein
MVSTSSACTHKLVGTEAQVAVSHTASVASVCCRPYAAVMWCCLCLRGTPHQRPMCPVLSCLYCFAAPVHIDEPTWRRSFASTGGIAVQAQPLPTLTLTSGKCGAQHQRLWTCWLCVYVLSSTHGLQMHTARRPSSTRSTLDPRTQCHMLILPTNACGMGWCKLSCDIGNLRGQHPDVVCRFFLLCRALQC